MSRNANLNGKPFIRHTGSTMIEVLVTIVIVAVGLLGYAGLLIKSNKNTMTAYTRSQATFLAEDIAERMRVNLAAAKGGSYNTTIGGTLTGTTLEAREVTGWKSLISQNLPAGDGSVTVDAQGNAIIIIQWSDGAGNTQSFKTQTRI